MTVSSSTRVPGDGLELHAREADGRVALDADDTLARRVIATPQRGGDGETRPDAHRPERAGVDPRRQQQQQQVHCGAHARITTYTHY